MLNFFNRPQDSDPVSLQIEALEQRQMLSTVSIFAAGSTGTEAFEVTANGESLASFGGDVSLIPTEITEFQFDVDNSVDASDIRIEFLNDAYDPATGFDRNLTIDKIRVDNRLYETENGTVFSTGTWTAADGIQSGFGRGETLHGNGYFQYSSSGFSGYADITEVTIDVNAYGDQVDFELQVDGQTVKNYALAPGVGLSSGVFDYTLEGDVSADRIRVALTNDKIFVDPISGVTIDRNLQVHSVTIDGEVYRGSDGDVFSTGTWLASEGAVNPGLGRGEFLHANGYFQFSERTSVTTDITVDATALGLNVDDVRFEIQIDGQADGFYGISPLRTGNYDRVVTITVDGEISPDQVRIAFISDFNTPQLDRNIRINSVRIGEEVFDPADPSVFSTGTWRPEDGVTDGFGRGNVLHSNGYFQFA